MIRILIVIGGINIRVYMTFRVVESSLDQKNNENSMSEECLVYK